MTNGTGLARGTLYHIFARIVFLLSGYAVHIYLGRKLGAGLYGTAGVIISAILLIRIFMITGISQAVSKLTAQYMDLAGAIMKKAFILQASMAVISGAVLYLSSGFLAGLLNDASLANYFRVCAFIIPLLGIYAVYQSTLGGLKRFGEHALMITVFSVVRVTAVIALVSAGFKIYGLLGGWVIAIVAAALLGFFYTRKIDRKGSFTVSRIFLFSLPLIMFSLGNALLINLDLLFVKSLVAGPEQTGFYTAAAALAKTPYNIFTAFTLTVLPSVSAAISVENRELVNKYIRQSMRYLLMMTIPLAYIVSFSAEKLVLFLYPENFAPAGAPLGILIWGQTFITVFAVLAAVLIGTGNSVPVTVSAFALIPVNIILNIILIPRFGLEGAATATLITAFSGMGVLSLVTAAKHCPPFNALSLIRICAAGLISSAFFYFLPLKGFLIIPAYLAAGAIYCALLFAFREINRDDLSVLANMLKNKEVRV